MRAALVFSLVLVAACSSNPSEEVPPGLDEPGVAAASTEAPARAAESSPAVPARPDDGVKNGDETDVDCGGSTGIKCETGKGCKVHADCAIDACLDGRCALGRSCKSHYGGATCGSGEPGAPDAKHEDCCTTLDVPRPTGTIKMDKYLVTAGRMRAFIEAVHDDVRGWAAANPPPGWNATYAKSVPANATDVAQQLGAGQSGATSYGGSLGPGCYVKGKGAPAYWLPEDVQANANGDVKRLLTQEQLDTKVMNCATRALFVAFCHWDGGRLPTYDEWKFAVNGGVTSHTYPWGTGTPIGNFASYNFNYAWPAPPGADDLDRGGNLPAPGRFPQGAGPFGHLDLAGALENFSADDAQGGFMQYSFQEAGKEQFSIAFGTKRNWVPSTKHWAVGARCVR